MFEKKLIRRLISLCFFTRGDLLTYEPRDQAAQATPADRVRRDLHGGHQGSASPHFGEEVYGGNFRTLTAVPISIAREAVLVKEGSRVTHYQILRKKLAAKRPSKFKGTKRWPSRGRQSAATPRLGSWGNIVRWEVFGSKRPLARRSAVCWESRGREARGGGTVFGAVLPRAASLLHSQ